MEVECGNGEIHAGASTKEPNLDIQAHRDRVRLTIDAVNAHGETTQAHNNGTFDGKPYPVKFANLSLMQTTKWNDAFTLTEVNTLDGKPGTSRTVVISKDGKTLTVTSKGVNPQGQPTSSATVYEKQ